MRATKLSVVMAFLAAAALQTAAAPQAPRLPGTPPANSTEVKGHVMGESMAVFLAKENLPDTITPCRQVIQNYKPYKRPTLEDCQSKNGTDFLKCLHHGEREAEDAEGEYRKCREHVKGDLVTLEVPSFGTGGPFGAGAEFRDGKLVRATLQISFSQALPTEVIRHLSDKYGEPQKEGALLTQNAFGVTDRIKVASWTMPDGTEIFAIQGGFLHPESTITEVTFTAKSEAERVRQDSQRPKKNPFQK